MAVALLVAAGRGERLGASGPKAFVMLAGRPLLQWSLDALAAARSVQRIVVALPPPSERAGGAGGAPGDPCPLPPGISAPPGTIGVCGGAARSASVAAALGAGPGDPVVVHDAARPLLDAALVDRAVAELDAHGADAAIAAAPVTDTIKQAGAGGEVEATLDRSRLWAVQTPQVFRRAALEAALAVPADVLAAATDDASLVERAGGVVRVVAAPRENLKVTTPLDLRVAELLLAGDAGEGGTAGGTPGRRDHAAGGRRSR